MVPVSQLIYRRHTHTHTLHLINTHFSSHLNVPICLLLLFYTLFLSAHYYLTVFYFCIPLVMMVLFGCWSLGGGYVMVVVVVVMAVYRVLYMFVVVLLERSGHGVRVAFPVRAPPRNHRHGLSSSISSPFFNLLMICGVEIIYLFLYWVIIYSKTPFFLYFHE